MNDVLGGFRGPAVIAEHFSEPHPFALIEFVEGTLFSDSLYLLDPEDLAKIAFDAGATLQAIHSFDLGQAGFFDEDFVFNPVFDNFVGSLYDYICWNLNARRVREMLGRKM